MSSGIEAAGPEVGSYEEGGESINEAKGQFLAEYEARVREKYGQDGEVKIRERAGEEARTVPVGEYMEKIQAAVGQASKEQLARYREIAENHFENFGARENAEAAQLGEREQVEPMTEEEVLAVIEEGEEELGDIIKKVKEGNPVLAGRLEEQVRTFNTGVLGQQYASPEAYIEDQLQQVVRDQEHAAREERRLAGRVDGEVVERAQEGAKQLLAREESEEVVDKDDEILEPEDFEKLERDEEAPESFIDKDEMQMKERAQEYGLKLGGYYRDGEGNFWRLKAVGVDQVIFENQARDGDAGSRAGKSVSLGELVDSDKSLQGGWKFIT